jgi:hypothetical protein
VGGRQFVGDAHAAVQLHRLLADEARAWPTRYLAADTAWRRSAGIAGAQAHGRQQGHRARLLEVDVHVGHAVLQGLELADRAPNCWRVFR